MIENLVSILLISILVILFLGMGVSSSDGSGWLSGTLMTFPYYLFIIGTIIMFVVSISYFRIYLPILISFNCRRKVIMIGMAVSIAGVLLGIAVISAIIWSMIPGGMQNLPLLPGITGFLFFFMSLAILYSLFLFKGGKFVVILFTILSVICAACVGAFVATDGVSIIIDFISSWSLSWLLFAGGILLFIGASILCMTLIRKLEIRS